MHESGDFSWNSIFTLINWHLLHDKKVQIKFYHHWISTRCIFLFQSSSFLCHWPNTGQSKWVSGTPQSTMEKMSILRMEVLSRKDCQCTHRRKWSYYSRYSSKSCRILFEWKIYFPGLLTVKHWSIAWQHNCNFCTLHFRRKRESREREFGNTALNIV